MWGVIRTPDGWQATWYQKEDGKVVRFPFGTPRHTEAEALAYARRLADRYEQGPAVLLAAPEPRREVVVNHDGETLRFPSKAEAKRIIRTRLRVKRLPSSVVDQIEGR